MGQTNEKIPAKIKLKIGKRVLSFGKINIGLKLGPSRDET
jgi:hypothetical protein